MNEAKNCTIWNLIVYSGFILRELLLWVAISLPLGLYCWSCVGYCVTPREMCLTACRGGTLYACSGARCGAQQISIGRKRVSWRRGWVEQSGQSEESLHVCSVAPWYRCVVKLGHWPCLVQMISLAALKLWDTAYRSAKYSPRWWRTWIPALQKCPRPKPSLLSGDSSSSAVLC